MQYLEFKRDKYFQRVYTQKLNPIDQPYSNFFFVSGHFSQMTKDDSTAGGFLKRW